MNRICGTLISFGCLVAGSPAMIRAECVATTPQVVEIRVQECVTSGAFAQSATPCLGSRWFTSLQQTVVARSPGVVVSGKIIETSGPPVTGETSGTWYVVAQPGRSSQLTCSDMAPNSVVPFLLWAPCCDVIPPYNFPCWFGVGQLQPLVQKKLQ